MDYSRCFDYCNGFKINRLKSKFLILLLVYFGYDIEYLSATNGFGCTVFSFFSKKQDFNIVLIGAGLSHTVLKSVGIKPLLQGFLHV
jgi:hypothetical protein